MSGRNQDASSYLRKEVSAAEEALKVSSKATKAAVENAKGSFDGNVPVLQCWQDMLTSIDTYNQKQAEVLSATHNEMKDATKELEQTRKAVGSGGREERLRLPRVLKKAAPGASARDEPGRGRGARSRATGTSWSSL